MTFVTTLYDVLSYIRAATFHLFSTPTTKRKKSKGREENNKRKGREKKEKKRKLRNNFKELLREARHVTRLRH